MKRKETSSLSPFSLKLEEKGRGYRPEGRPPQEEEIRSAWRKKNTDFVV